MKTGKPTLVIETSPAGVKTVTIRVPQGRRAEGLAFLHQVLPAIRELDRRTRGGEHLDDLARGDGVPPIQENLKKGGRA